MPKIKKASRSSRRLSRISNRGFASMVKTRKGRQRQRKIAERGGVLAHTKRRGKKKAHEFTEGKEAEEAGRKGGLASHGGRGRGSKPSKRSKAKPRQLTEKVHGVASIDYRKSGALTFCVLNIRTRVKPTRREAMSLLPACFRAILRSQAKRQKTRRGFV